MYGADLNEDRAGTSRRGWWSRPRLANWQAFDRFGATQRLNKLIGATGLIVRRSLSLAGVLEKLHGAFVLFCGIT